MYECAGVLIGRRPAAITRVPHAHFRRPGRPGVVQRARRFSDNRVPLPVYVLGFDSDGRFSVFTIRPGPRSRDRRRPVQGARASHANVRRAAAAYQVPTSPRARLRPRSSFPLPVFLNAIPGLPRPFHRFPIPTTSSAHPNVVRIRLSRTPQPSSNSRPSRNRRLQLPPPNLRPPLLPPNPRPPLPPPNPRIPPPPTTRPLQTPPPNLRQRRSRGAYNNEYFRLFTGNRRKPTTGSSPRPNFAHRAPPPGIQRLALHRPLPGLHRLPPLHRPPLQQGHQALPPGFRPLPPRPTPLRPPPGLRPLLRGSGLVYRPPPAYYNRPPPRLPSTPAAAPRPSAQPPTVPRFAGPPPPQPPTYQP